jgi:hypothetical protein
LAQDLTGQVGGEPASSGPLRGEASEPKQLQTDEERMRFLKDLYGKSDMSQDGSPNPDKQAIAPEEKPVDKSVEEQKELLSLRNQLHKENYYDPTFNSVKGQEERPAEKVENEKKQEMMELQQKEEKKQPIAVQRERNKAEQFGGATG